MASTRPSEVTNHASGRENLGADEAVPMAAPNALKIRLDVHHLPRPLYSTTLRRAAYSLLPLIRTNELTRPSYSTMSGSVVPCTGLRAKPSPISSPQAWGEATRFGAKHLLPCPLSSRRCKCNRTVFFRILGSIYFLYIFRRPNEVIFVTSSRARAPRHVSRYPSPHPASEARVFHLCSPLKIEMTGGVYPNRRISAAWYSPTIAAVSAS